MDKVGDRIKKLRLARKLTQDQVAQAIGIKQGSFTQLERGISKSPSSVTLTRLARFFEVDPDWLMTGKGAQTPVAALSEAETDLIVVFRELSADGQGYILGRAKAMRLDEHAHRGGPMRRRDDRSPDRPDKDGH